MLLFVNVEWYGVKKKCTAVQCFKQFCTFTIDIKYERACGISVFTVHYALLGKYNNKYIRKKRLFSFARNVPCNK